MQSDSQTPDAVTGNIALRTITVLNGRRIAQLQKHLGDDGFGFEMAA